MPHPDAVLIRDLDWIVELDANPILRNLLITQSYHDLSVGMTSSLGSQNANWCTFATWASRTAGGFVRDDEVPARLRSVVQNSSGYVEAKESLGRLGFAFDRDRLLQLPSAIVGDISEQIMLGNLKVYAELGPLFSLMIRTFNQDAPATSDQLALVLATLTDGPPERGGQTLLGSGVTAYFGAMRESDPKKKAERILFANGLVGLHEQIRLQPSIANALDAPVADTINDVAAALLRALPETLRHGAEPVVKTLLHPVIADLERDWDDAATRELMTLKVPGETLHLGAPLPPLPDQSQYAALLQTIDDPDLRNMLEQYECLTIAPTASTRDWANLDERMGYILNLFRSRQLAPDLFDQPFTDSQRVAVLDHTVPDGPLG